MHVTPRHGTGGCGVTHVERVQRVPARWPVVHLEPEIPEWNDLTLEGHVAHARRFTLNDLAVLGSEERVIDFHCVWGWSRPQELWTGVGLDRVLELVGATGSHVTVHSASDEYSACLPIEDARRGFLAWARDGARLQDVEGGPLRFLPPPELWGYKGVKWADRARVGDRFVAGFWEVRIGDPVGRIPSDVVLP
jgi:DMSO/TMAO reductase YedYZ molybdopterin-dependent catalytic subunit